MDHRQNTFYVILVLCFMIFAIGVMAIPPPPPEFTPNPSESSPPPENSCQDQVTNGGESDVDCGGICAPCANGKGCNGNGDCQSQYCSGNYCASGGSSSSRSSPRNRSTLNQSSSIVPPENSFESQEFQQPSQPIISQPVQQLPEQQTPQPVEDAAPGEKNSLLAVVLIGSLAVNLVLIIGLIYFFIRNTQNKGSLNENALQQLAAYVEKYSKFGYPKSVIKQKLREGGWSEEYLSQI